MTPDPKQVNELAGILAVAHTNDMTHQETAELLFTALQPAIAAALRTARYEVLEEAASHTQAEQRPENARYTGRADGSWWETGGPEWRIRNTVAYELRALKHKDGQP